MVSKDTKAFRNLWLVKLIHVGLYLWSEVVVQEHDGDISAKHNRMTVQFSRILLSYFILLLLPL